MRGDLAPARRVLAALVRGVVGDGYRPELPGRVLDLIDGLGSERDRRQILNALRLGDSRAGALLLTGRPVPLSWLAAAEAEALLRRWSASRLGNLRALAGAVISFSLFALYAHRGSEWNRIGYPGPLGDPPSTPKRLEPLVVDRDEVLNCDAVVVGSGAGGGCVAAELAQRGFDVVVVEKGGYRSESDFSHLEADASRDLYLYGKRLATSDLGVLIVAGSTLGGGTLVNYATSFKTPDYVLEQWARVSGIDAFVSGEFAASLDAVAARLNVNTDSSAAGKRDQLLEEGLKELGWHVDNMPRAVRGCTQDESCGYCGFGCRVAGKQSTMVTYLEDAARAGARIVTEADVGTVHIEDGRATAIEARARGHSLVVNARAVIIAAGAIETAALLLRSGLGGQVGRNLRLHPGCAAWGVFDEDVRAWEGTTQARYSGEFRHWDGGYGPLFETVPVHPGEFATALPWTSAADHREVMADYGRVSFGAVLPRDASAGRVRLARDGSPVIDYRLSVDDQRRIADGIVAAGRVMEAAGARLVNSPHVEPIPYEPGVGGGHDAWARATQERGYSTRRVRYFSYHQMGSCRMGVDPTTSAIGPNNESHEVADLFVVDGSAFPTASGVNPMLSIYGIAHRAAGQIAARLS